jgi:ketosteroid isomerase-like protein
MQMRQTLWLAAVILLVPFWANDIIAQVASADTGGISATVEGFHHALQQGDRAAALKLLAPDAAILESGESQTRVEYEREHLDEDIAFARATTTDRSPLNIQQNGNVAWTIATSKTKGTFKDRQIDNAGVELMVLTKGDSGWRIRAIHWSSRKTK